MREKSAFNNTKVDRGREGKVSGQGKSTEHVPLPVEQRGLVKGGLEELSKETHNDRREMAQSKGHVSAGSQ